MREKPENMETNDQARETLLIELYNDLRGAAARLLRREAPYITMQPTELVNEAALKLMQIETMTWTDRQHFYAIGARLLRQAMMDAIRRRNRLKRQMPPSILNYIHPPANMDTDALDDALSKLELANPELSRLVEMRYFVGLNVDEIAAVCDKSPATIHRQWKTARAWLANELVG